MLSFPSHRGAISVGLFAVAVIAGGTGLAVQARQKARRALVDLEARKQEWAGLARRVPAASEENLHSVRRAVDEAGTALAGLQGAFSNPALAPGRSAETNRSVDAYFGLADYVEQARRRAQDAGVATRPDERFGFAAFANAGPEPEFVPAVLRQRARLQPLVEALIEARPRGVLAVQRERPAVAPMATAPNRGDPARPGASDMAAGDYFTLPASLALRWPGELDGEAFRLEFSGPTRALREFLTGLANVKPLVFVRSVEAELPGAGSAPAAGSAVEVVAQNVARFAVVVEFVEPATERGPVAP
jgi:hypothetical protein